MFCTFYVLLGLVPTLLLFFFYRRRITNYKRNAYPQKNYRKDCRISFTFVSILHLRIIKLLILPQSYVPVKALRRTVDKPLLFRENLGGFFFKCLLYCETTSEIWPIDKFANPFKPYLQITDEIPLAPNVSLDCGFGARKFLQHLLIPIFAYSSQSL